MSEKHTPTHSLSDVVQENVREMQSLKPWQKTNKIPMEGQAMKNHPMVLKNAEHYLKDEAKKLSNIASALARVGLHDLSIEIGSVSECIVGWADGIEDARQALSALEENREN